MNMMIKAKVENLEENDLIIYDGEKWVSYKKDIFLASVNKKNKELEKEINLLKNELLKTKENISKLAEIVKGEIK